MSRSRVAPLKKITVPRLELLAALVLARLINFVKTSLQLGENVPCFCWSDSKVTLAWIRGDPLKWKTFVMNRCIEIQSLTKAINWNYIPTLDNPADLISRGMLANDLVSSFLWLNGPPWLTNFIDFEKIKVYPLKYDVETKKTKSACLISISAINFNIERFSTLMRAQRVVAWVLRYKNNLNTKKTKISGPLTSTELNLAKISLIHLEQERAYSDEIMSFKAKGIINKSSSIIKLDPILDSDGLLRVGGRLQNSDLDYNSQHPIILPSGHFSFLLVRFQHFFLHHAGVGTLITTLRNNYWVVGLRRLAKTVHQKCIRCQRHDSRALNQISPPLPDFRVKRSPAFYVTGIDFAGPLFSKDFPGSKHYILLFTCAVVRALHIEITNSLNLSDFLLAFRRFVARRGMPGIILSDNAKTFISASKELHRVFSIYTPEWKFIPPASPWWGGWWERLVRSIKLSLKKSFHLKSLPREELVTSVTEIEAFINSRPLTYISDDLHDKPLTPSHFLIGRPAGYLPKVVNPDTPFEDQDLRNLYSSRQQVMEKFWSTWSNNYIRNLPPVVGGFKASRLAINDLVLIRQDKIPRLQWPIGRVINVFPGKDSLIRSVEIKTEKGIFKRDIKNLHFLESHANLKTLENLPQDDKINVTSLTDLENVNKNVIGIDSNCTSQEVQADVVTPKTSTGSNYTTRSGRIVKPPQRLVAD